VIFWIILEEFSEEEDDDEGVGKSNERLEQESEEEVVTEEVIEIFEVDEEGISSERISSSYGIILIFVLRLKPTIPTTIPVV
jgi:hypothetical protein